MDSYAVSPCFLRYSSSLLYPFFPKPFEEVKDINTLDFAYSAVDRVEGNNHLLAFWIVGCKSLEPFQVPW